MSFESCKVTFDDKTMCFSSFFIIKLFSKMLFFFCCSVSESQIISVLQSLEDVRFGLTDMFLMFPPGEVKRHEMQIVDSGDLRCYLGHEQCQQLFCTD